MLKMSEREYCIKTYGVKDGNELADYWERVRASIKANPTIIQAPPRRITPTERLLMESLAMIERYRDQLLLRTEKRIMSGEATKFCERVHNDLGISIPPKP